MYSKSTEELTHLLLETDSFDTYSQTQQEEFLDMSLCDYLNHLIEQGHQTTYKVIQSAGLDVSYGYKVFRGDHVPSRDVLIKLAFSMSLTLDKTQHLLRVGKAHTLYPRDERDALLMYCLNQKLDMVKTNDLLYHHKLDTL